MSEPRKPIFGFLWPDRSGPVDDEYRQVRRSRVAGRGPVRIIALTIVSLATVGAGSVAVLAALDVGLTAGSVVGSALAATLLVLTLRGWVVGTYVTDAGVSVERTWRTTALTWQQVDRIDEHAGPVPLLGLPVKVPGRRCVLVRRDGTRIATHVYTASPDLWLRPEAFDIARLRLNRWLDERTGPPAGTD